MRFYHETTNPKDVVLGLGGRENRQDFWGHFRWFVIAVYLPVCSLFWCATLPRKVYSWRCHEICKGKGFTPNSSIFALVDVSTGQVYSYLVAYNLEHEEKVLKAIKDSIDEPQNYLYVAEILTAPSGVVMGSLLVLLTSLRKSILIRTWLFVRQKKMSHRRTCSSNLDSRSLTGRKNTSVSEDLAMLP